MNTTGSHATCVVHGTTLVETRVQRMGVDLTMWSCPRCNAVATGGAQVTWPTLSHDDVAELRADKERLDFMDAERTSVGHHRDTNRWWSRAGGSFKNVREAIDAARRQP